MEWTAADILQSIGLVITLGVAIAGWLKNSAEREKLEAETAGLYANIAAEGAKREKQYKIDIQSLEMKIDGQDIKIAELTEIIEKKDKRIKELETLTHKQDQEIAALQKELIKLQPPTQTDNA